MIMKFDEIITFIEKYDSISIYGAGELGRSLLEVLQAKKIKVDAFIISDDQPIDKSMISSIPVFSLSDWNRKNPLLKRCVLIAVSDLYQAAVTKNLNRYGIVDYLPITFEALHEDMRCIHPLRPEKFFASLEPVSREFGMERGTPIDRVYIEQFLYKAAKDLSNVSTILEVGSDTYSRKFFNNDDLIQYDILRHEQGVDLTNKATLPHNHYDVFVCTQVFNFIYDVKAAIRGAYYLLKPGGTLLATVQGNVGQVSRTDMKLYGDYWRFTDLGIGLLISEVFGDDQVRVYPYGNALIATAFVQGLSLEDLEDESLLDSVESEYAINIGVIATKRKKL